MNVNTETDTTTETTQNSHKLSCDARILNMNKYYVTLGQDHAHHVNNTTLDRDSVLCVEAKNMEEARVKVFNTIGNKFHRVLTREEIAKILHYFQRGVVTTI